MCLGTTNLEPVLLAHTHTPNLTLTLRSSIENRIKSKSKSKSKKSPAESQASVFRFMKGPHSFFRMHWNPEPLAFPRRSESADKSDALQTLRVFRRVIGRRVSVWSACVFS